MMDANDLAPGDAVRFREPLSPDVWTRGEVLYILDSGLVGIRPEGCYVSRVLCAADDVERA